MPHTLNDREPRKTANGSCALEFESQTAAENSPEHRAKPARSATSNTQSASAMAGPAARSRRVEDRGPCSDQRQGVVYARRLSLSASPNPPRAAAPCRDPRPRGPESSAAMAPVASWTIGAEVVRLLQATTTPSLALGAPKVGWCRNVSARAVDRQRHKTATAMYRPGRVLVHVPPAQLGTAAALCRRRARDVVRMRTP